MDTRSWLYLCKDEMIRSESQTVNVRVQKRQGRIGRVEFTRDGLFLLVTVFQYERPSKCILYDVLNFYMLWEMEIDTHVTISQNFLDNPVRNKIPNISHVHHIPVPEPDHGQINGASPPPKYKHN